MRTHWDPFTDMAGLRQDVNRLLDGFGRGGRPFRSVFLPGRSARSYPRINISDDPEKIRVDALAPGLDTNTLEVSVKGDTLTLAGEKKPLEGITRESFHRSERSTGRFVRVINLASEIDEGNLSAEYRDGILSVTLAKSERAKPKQITVNVK